MSSSFKLVEVKSEDGNRDYHIEGYISTIDPDFANDIVDSEGQESTYEGLKGKGITMDLDHEEWRDPETGEEYDGKKNKIPVAIIVDAELDSYGTWVKARLNKNHPEYETILANVREGYLHSFSIAYRPTKWYEKVIDNMTYRVIQGLKIANVAITGNPVNQNATFNVALKSMTKKMAEENKIQELEKSNQEFKSQIESLENQLSELKATDYKKMYEDMKAKYDKMMAEKDKEDDEDKKKDSGAETKSQTELKSLKDSFEEQKKEIAELKSVVEKIRETPVNSAQFKSQSGGQKQNEIAEIDFKSLVGGTE